MVNPRTTGFTGNGLPHLAPVAGAMSLLAACLIMSPKRPLWYDEIATRMLVTDPSIGHMLRSMVAGVENAPPLFHLIARGWVAVFGDGDTALRMLSASGMAAGLCLLWASLRSTFGNRAASVGALTVFGTSELVLRQNHEFRFYGVWMGFCALAVYYTVRFMRTRTPTRGTLVGGAVASAAVTLTHTFGVLYVGVLLLAVGVADAIGRRFRPAVYGAYVFGWLAFAPWILPTIEQSGLSAARSWVAVPGLGALFPAYGFGMVFLPMVLVGIVLLNIWDPNSREILSEDELEHDTIRRNQSLITLGLFLVPLLLFAVSRVVRPVFVDRYMLPSILGWGFVVAFLVEPRAINLLQSADGRFPVPMKGIRGTGLTNVGWVALCAALAALPTLRALGTPATGLPASSLEALRDQYAMNSDSIAVAVESGLLFLPLAHYDEAGREAFFYPSDWNLALDPASPSTAVAFDQYLRMLREHYGLKGIVDSPAFLCRAPRFLVLDGPWLWFERHVQSDPAFATRDVGRFNDETVVRLVERRSGATLQGCGE